MLRAIITAAGYSARFRGVYKEMLPIWYNNTITTALEVNIEQAINLFGADEVVIVSRPEKAAEHLKIAAQYDNVSVIPYRFDPKYDLLGSIVSGATHTHCNNDCILMLADTVKIFKYTVPMRNTCIIGTFLTEKPNRFSIIVDNKIYHKPTSFDGIQKAWGLIKWPAEHNMTMHRQMLEGDTYDDVFNQMIISYGYTEMEIDKYYDLGSFKAYAEYMVEHYERDSNSSI